MRMRMGRKWKRRKGQYVKGPFAKPWTGRHKETAQQANRRERRHELDGEV